MRSSRLIWLALAAAAIAAAVWYRKGAMNLEAPRAMGSVAVVTGGSSPYWQAVANGARAAGEDLGVAVKIFTPEQDESVAEQTAMLSKLDMNGVSGVAVSPLDAEGQTPLIDKIATQAVVVTFDSDAPESKRDTYIGTNNHSAGLRAARLVQEAIPDGGKVLVVLANLTKDNMIQRREGFEQTVAKAQSPGENSAAEYDVIDFLVDEGNEAKCRELVVAALEAHPDLACLVGMNSYHGPLLVKLLEGNDRLGKIKLVTFDDDPKTLQGVEAGHIHATVVQDPYLYGYNAVEWLAKVCRGHEGLRPLDRSRSTFSVNTQSVRQENLADFRRQVSERSESAPAG